MKLTLHFGSEILLPSTIYDHHVLVPVTELLKEVIISLLPLLGRVFEPLYVVLQLIVLAGGDLDWYHLLDKAVIGILLLLLQL